MRVQLLVTKTDFNLPNLEKELNALGVGFEIDYIEDHPEMVASHKIRHSPNIIIDGKLVFRRQPTETELKACLAQH